MASLFLQGPLGPFFSKLITELRRQDYQAYKINFNAGDSSYAAMEGCYDFSDALVLWPKFLEDFVLDKNITAIFVYGDCRIYHSEAKKVADKLNINFYVFEEGYIRPNRITLEKDGVNGYQEYCAKEVAHWQEKEVKDEKIMGGSLMLRTWYCTRYYNVGNFRQDLFPHYQHHRSFSAVKEAVSWWRAAGRHYLFRLTQAGIQKRLVDKYSGRFFLLPLQVFNDAQIRFHSNYESMQEFIEQMMASFAEHADSEQLLVIKHHPMDRGHVHYGDFIEGKIKQYGLAGRVLYVHDLHLPTLLKHCSGVVTINSTTAISAFYHQAPVKVMGEAFFDMPRITSQQSLAEFWQKPEQNDHDFFLCLRNYLIAHGQVNGSFYKHFDITVANVIAEMKDKKMI